MKQLTKFYLKSVLLCTIALVTSKVSIQGGCEDLKIGLTNPGKRATEFTCCLIEAQKKVSFGKGPSQAQAYYDVSDASLLFIITQVQQVPGLESVEFLVLTTCGNLCFIQAQNSSSETLAIYDANYVSIDPNSPLLTVDQVQQEYGLGSVDRLDLGTCGDSCFIQALNSSFEALAIYDASDVSQPLLTVSEAQAIYGLESVTQLTFITCGDSCLIPALDASFAALAIYDASNPNSPLLTVGDVKAIYDLETVTQLAISTCGDSCLVLALNSSSETLAIYDASNPDSPLLTLSGVQAVYGLESVDELVLLSCGDSCFIEATASSLTQAIYDASDTSSPLLTVSDVQAVYGLESVDRLGIRICGNLCLIEARNGSGTRLAIYDASEVSSPLLTVDDVKAVSGLESVNQLSFSTCGDSCLIEAEVSGLVIAVYKVIYGSVDPSSPLLRLDDVQAVYGLETVVRLITVSCGDGCLIEANLLSNQTLAIYDTSDTSSPLLTVDDVKAVYGLESVDRLETSACGDRCFIEAQNNSPNTIALYDASYGSVDASSPLLTLDDVQAVYSLEAVTQLFVNDCGVGCFIEVKNSSFSTLGVYDINDPGSPVLTVGDVQAEYGLETIIGLVIETCKDICFIEAENSSFDILAIYDASDVSSPLLTVEQVREEYDLLTVDRLALGTCDDCCFIEAQNSSSETVAIYKVSYGSVDSRSPFLTVEQVNADFEITVSCVVDSDDCDGYGSGALTATILGGTPPYTVTIYGPTSDTQVSLYSDISFTGLKAGTYTITVTDDTVYCTAETTCDIPGAGSIYCDACGPFPDLDISGLEDLVVCRGKEFCYELTVTNPVNIYQNQDSGNITVTGLLDAVWTVTEVIDCSNAETSYSGPIGSVWENPFDQNITFNESGTGTWTIGVLQAGESICLKLCGTDPNVGNKSLDIKVSQTISN